MEATTLFERGEAPPGLAEEVNRVAADYIQKRLALQEDGLVALLAAYMAETGHKASNLTLVMQNTRNAEGPTVRAWFEPKGR